MLMMEKSLKFEELFNTYKWKPIPDCPGRYLLYKNCNKEFNAMYFNLTDIKEFKVDKARDTVLVCRFKDGGLISFKHQDGYVVHSLNNQDGFLRKLDHLGIDLKH